jgi:hypothetical protein
MATERKCKYTDAEIAEVNKELSELFANHKLEFGLTRDDIVRDIREGRGYTDEENLEYDRMFGTNMMGRKREQMEALKKKEAAMAAGQ